MTRWHRLARLARRVAPLIVVMTVVSAIGGAVAGTRMAAEAGPPAEIAAPVEAPAEAPVEAPTETPAAPARLARRHHALIGRVMAVEDDTLHVRRPRGRLVTVQIAPSTVVRRAGERVTPDAIQAGDRVVVVGRVVDDGVLQARGIRARPMPLRPPPGEGRPAPPSKPRPPQGLPAPSGPSDAPEES
jgi:hypothetical protein